MRIKKSTVIGLAIATVLTAYISALTLSNQAFAINNIDPQNPASSLEGQAGHEAQVGQILAGHEAQAGKILEGRQASHSGLGCDPWDPRGC